MSSPETVVSAPAADEVPPEAVAPLMRGLAVLRALTDADGALGLPALERTTGLARSTVDRIAATLAHLGYLRLDGRVVTLAPPLMELGNAYLAALRLPDLLGPHARRLADELGESVSLAVAEGDGVRFVHQSTRRRTLSVSFRVGDLLPVECVAPGPLVAAGWGDPDWERWRRRRAADPMGRAFTALPPREATRLPTPKEFAAWARQAGERGFALDDQLIEPGLVALSVPVRHSDGTTACVASLVSHTSRHSAEELRERLMPRLREAVDAMERALTNPAAPAPEPSPEERASWIAASKQELGREFVGSLARGLSVLTAFGAGRGALTLAAVAQATGQARATARRALITLEHLGYVAATSGVFRPTSRVLALGYAPLSRLRLPQIARPHLAALAERIQDSTSLAVLDGKDVRYTARVASRRIMSVEITVGTRFPAYATSMGRVLLADLPPADRAAWLDRVELRPLTPATVTDRGELAGLVDRAAAEGYALVDEELEEGLRSIAVPVRDRAGRAVAAVNVATHTGRRTARECVAEVLPALRATADGISADLRVASRFAALPTV
ncbi:IclR family transcriptional regulator domain-containing protein [Streptomyces sp. 4N509B]|uniref:IclR family transcriptional regulator domain-containing protein n=1 Tax=Streptomyces sp. 4N509B TaxID=3457413 RepID=UPI003FCEEFB9